MSHKKHASSPIITLPDVVQAYLDCRKNKRNSEAAVQFECNLEDNLYTLYRDLVTDKWHPRPASVFVVTKPVCREVWAADFRDRIVHHLVYNLIGPRFERTFHHDSSACRKGRGTLFALFRVRKIVNRSQRQFYLKMDISNFFCAINRRVLLRLLFKRVPERFLRMLLIKIVCQDLLDRAIIKSPKSLLKRVPSNKSLFNSSGYTGLPIGNLSSQFFANVYLDELDKTIKGSYSRYVDDFICFGSKEYLLSALPEINRTLGRIKLSLNPTKTKLQPVKHGIDYVGGYVKPGRIRNRLSNLNKSLAAVTESVPSANSRLGRLAHIGSRSDIGQHLVRLYDAGFNFKAKCTGLYAQA